MLASTLQRGQLSKKSWRGYFRHFWKEKIVSIAGLCGADEKWCFGWMKWKLREREREDRKI